MTIAVAVAVAVVTSATVLAPAAHAAEPDPAACRPAEAVLRAPSVLDEALPRTLAPGCAPRVTEPAPVVQGSGLIVRVVDDAGLRAALGKARPGDTILLAAGRYAPVEITGAGTAEQPITLAGEPGAVIDGGSSRGYAVHLTRAAHWQLTLLTVSGGGKGIVADGAHQVLLDRLRVGGTGDEAVHFRAGSSDNTIQHSVVHDTGRVQPQYGEGVYVGSAKSNWKRFSGGGPDLSMRNRVLDTTFERITAENVDVKEETGGTVIAGNRFDGSAISGRNFADSVVDVKGFGALVVDNMVTGASAALRNIIETHVITTPDRSGCGNTIERNGVQGFQPAGALVAVDPKCARTSP